MFSAARIHVSQTESRLEFLTNTFDLLFSIQEIIHKTSWQFVYSFSFSLGMVIDLIHFWVDLFLKNSINACDSSHVIHLPFWSRQHRTEQTCFCAIKLNGSVIWRDFNIASIKLIDKMRRTNANVNWTKTICLITIIICGDIKYLNHKNDSWHYYGERSTQTKETEWPERRENMSGKWKKKIAFAHFILCEKMLFRLDFYSATATGIGCSQCRWFTV